MEEGKVKVVRLIGGEPSKKETDVRWVTRTAADYLKGKWKIADDQSGAEEQKKTAAVAPVVSQEDRLEQIRKQYEDLSEQVGQSPHQDYKEFNQARLFVEIKNLKILQGKMEQAATIATTAEPEVEAPKVKSKKMKKEIASE